MSYHAALFAAAGQDRVPMFIGIPWVTTLGGGACSYDEQKDLWGANPPATVRVNWNVSDKDAALYEFKVYKDDVFRDTVAGSGSNWWHYVTGSNVIGGDVNTFNADWTYKVEIVRISDAQVLETGTTAEWTQLYGQCPIIA